MRRASATRAGRSVVWPARTLPPTSRRNALRHASDRLCTPPVLVFCHRSSSASQASWPSHGSSLPSSSEHLHHTAVAEPADPLAVLVRVRRVVQVQRTAAPALRRGLAGVHGAAGRQHGAERARVGADQHAGPAVVRPLLILADVGDRLAGGIQHLAQDRPLDRRPHLLDHPGLGAGQLGDRLALDADLSTTLSIVAVSTSGV